MLNHFHKIITQSNKSACFSRSSCSRDGSLSVKQTDIHMIQTENDKVKSLKSFLYKILQDIQDIYIHIYKIIYKIYNNNI